MRRVCLVVTLALAAPLGAQAPSSLHAEIDRRATAINPKVVAWRRDIHQNPELSFQETRTAKLVADHLRSLGLEVRTGVGGNGVVGILKGGRPGPVVALRADMDGLPVTEQVNLPFKSTVRGTWNGQEVGVMHACGHDNHVAILMGAAELLTGMKDRVPGTVKFIFQPAEETPPGGAGPMIKAGVLDNPRVNAIFGLHVMPGRLGSISYKSGSLMASADNFRIVVHGKQTHGAAPWGGVDPIVIGSQIVLALQTIVSRQLDITTAPAIVTVGAFNGGIRQNIIPDSAVMIGTFRALDLKAREQIIARIKRTAESIAQSAGGTADVSIELGYPVTVNDSALTAQMRPTLMRVAGADKVEEVPPITGAEDFSRFQEQVPGLFVFLGVTPDSKDWRTVPKNHSPLFEADEGALPVGVRTMAALAVDYLSRGTPGASTRVTP
jgi:amidohydrolase